MATPDRIAVLSDIHGNLAALEAVFADIDRRGIKHLVNLGDTIYGPLEPHQTAQMLIQANMPTVRGNEDRILIFPPEDPSGSPSLDHTTRLLTIDQILWLTSLPVSLVAFDCCFMFHGSPEQDDRYFLSEVTPDGVVSRGPDRLAAELDNTFQPVILCGHDHTPAVFRLPDGRLVVNPGSVGLQAYYDDHPYPHVMHTGSPHARYAILEQEGSGWKAEIVAVAYDWNRSADLAEAHGRPDWARWLRTGKANLG
jgi:predicted phosphodiesterase